MVAYTTEPALSSDEITDLLGDSQRASEWVTGTDYVVGDRVIPPVGNGHVYVCIQAGESDATEPDWPLSDSTMFDDGDDLQWREDGPAPDPLWDLNSAAYHGWLLKAGKASADYDFQSSGQRFSRAQLIEHCFQMADRYLPVSIA